MVMMLRERERKGGLNTVRGNYSHISALSIAQTPETPVTLDMVTVPLTY